MCDICNLMLRISALLAMLLIVALVGTLPLRAQSRAMSTVIINEMMYAPIAPEPEWIELYNFDSTQAVDVTGWKIVSGTTALLPVAMMLPHQFLVITKDSVVLRARRPGPYPILQAALPNLRN